MKLAEVLDMLKHGWHVRDLGLGHWVLRKQGEKFIILHYSTVKALKKRGLA